MKFTGFNLNYTPISHTDEHGADVNDGLDHDLTQGWLQSFSALNKILVGEWTSQKLTIPNTEQYLQQNPYALDLFLKFTADSSAQSVTLNGQFYGALDLVRGSVLVQKVVVEGSVLNIPNVLTNDIITGSLTPKN